MENHYLESCGIPNSQPPSFDGYKLYKPGPIPRLWYMSSTCIGDTSAVEVTIHLLAALNRIIQVACDWTYCLHFFLVHIFLPVGRKHTRGSDAEAFSPYGSSGTSIDCPGLDRRGHKLAMTHQRAPPRSSKDNHSTAARRGTWFPPRHVGRWMKVVKSEPATRGLMFFFWESVIIIWNHGILPWTLGFEKEYGKKNGLRKWFEPPTTTKVCEPSIIEGWKNYWGYLEGGYTNQK